MPHLRTKRKPKTNMNSIGKLILSVIFVFILMILLITLSNLTKENQLNPAKVNKAQAIEGDPWILDNTDVIFTPRGDQIFIQTSSTEEERETGLSGKDRLKMYNQANNIVTEGMLFVFDTESIHTFWMKDMNFDLDMIWLDSDYRIVHIEKNVKVSSYNREFPNLSKTFSNINTPAKYVLEINSGFVDKMNLKLGEELIIQ